MIPRRVIKLGGSLLDDARFPQRVRQWLDNQPPAQNLVCVGGGGCVDAMRILDGTFHLDEQAMHWRCVRLLRATFEVVVELFPQWQGVDTPEQLEGLVAAAPSSGTWLVAVDSFYGPQTSAASGLPIGWATTSDAIAAYLAELSSAHELVLLKSCPVPTASLSELAQAGIVDAAFPQAARGIPVRVERLGDG